MIVNYDRKLRSKLKRNLRSKRKRKLLSKLKRNLRSYITIAYIYSTGHGHCHYDRTTCIVQATALSIFYRYKICKFTYVKTNIFVVLKL